MKTVFAMAVMGVVAWAGVGRAAVITIDGTAYTTEFNAGAGTNSALLVLEYGAGGGGTYAFGYSWDTPAAGASGPSGADMLLAVAAASPSDGKPTLSVVSQTFDFGDGPVLQVDSISYGSQQVTYHYPDAWFGYYTSNDGRVWTSSLVGASDRSLTNGAFDDWVLQTSAAVAPDYADPNSPTFGSAGGGAVPEPASLGVLGLGAVGLLRRRR